MKNTVVQGLAEVPGSFLPSCPHVSTHEAPCRRKGKIKDRELSFLSERGSINGHRTAALLGHVESRPKGARLVQKWRETYIETWLWVGVSCFFFFSPPCLFIGKCIRCASLGLRCRAFVQCALNQRKAWRILCFFYDDWYKYSNIWVYINKIY